MFIIISQTSGKPLFRPTVPSLEHNEARHSSPALNDSIYSTESTRRPNNEDIFTDILRRDELLKQKRSLNQAKAAEDMIRDMSANQVKALQTSNSILKDSTEKHIEELFRMLVATSMEGHAVNNLNLNRIDLNGDGESECDDFKSRVLDFGVVQMDALVPEVGNLLRDMRKEYEEICRLNRTETYEDRESDEPHEPESILITFYEFRKLALRAIKHRNGTGKAYICAPRKKPELAMQMVINNLKEETFRPIIDKTSQQLAQRTVTSKLKSVAIEDVIHAEGERLKSKIEIARFEKFLKESKDYTYKPTLFKPPSYVKPKYRGLDSLHNSSNQEEENNENAVQNEQTDGQNSPSGHKRSSRVVYRHVSEVDYYDDDSSTILTVDGMPPEDHAFHGSDPNLPPLGGGGTATPCRVHDFVDISYLSSESPGDDDAASASARINSTGYLARHTSAALNTTSRTDGSVVTDSTRRDDLELVSLHHLYSNNNIVDPHENADDGVQHEEGGELLEEESREIEGSYFFDSNKRRDSLNSGDSFASSAEKFDSMHEKLKAIRSKHHHGHHKQSRSSAILQHRSGKNGVPLQQLQNGASFRPPPLPHDLVLEKMKKQQIQHQVEEHERSSRSPPPPPPPLNVVQ